MMSRIGAALRRLGRGFSRTERSVNLLSLPRYPQSGQETGLIMIQIDGLSREQFERALARGRMPFLAKLLKREEYQLFSGYSGLPSTTPACQAEIFYGIKGAVPSFEYRDHRTRKITSLLEGDTVVDVEDRLKSSGHENLLADGSAYGDIYSGGREHSSFCVSTMGRGELLKKANRVALATVLLLHSFVLVRMAALAVTEVFLAFYDIARRAHPWRDLPHELFFVLKRVALCISLRELATALTRMDAARGVPVIHCNFFGYDEQSHRRGPSSRFAHWTLKGIDYAIRRIWHSAHRSSCRHYDVWIYSDHGQERVQPYEKLHGRVIHEAVAEVYAKHGVRAEPAFAETTGVQLRRVVVLGGRWLQKLLGLPRPRPRPVPVAMASMGPVAHVHTLDHLPPDVRDAVARDLVEMAHVPMVLCADGPRCARAWTRRGVFSLPEQLGEALRSDRPALAEMREDLVALAHHPDAGRFILIGWDPEGPSVSFTYENGAHGGPGPHETHPFALLPQDARLPLRAGGFFRHLDLRAAALHHTRRGPDPFACEVVPRRDKDHLRIMTYNVHSCIGLDGIHAPERLARIIARYSPDVVALQELDVGRRRSASIHHARHIAKLLAMDYHFHPSFVIGEEQYGNAILSRLPMRLVKAGALPGDDGMEPRGAIWAEINCEGRRIQLFNTHLSLSRRERIRQIQALMGAEWFGAVNEDLPVIICGDFNSLPGSQVYRLLVHLLQDTHRISSPARPTGTWMQIGRLDYIFATSHVRILGTSVPRTALTRVASDHLPLIAEMELERMSAD